MDREKRDSINRMYELSLRLNVLVAQMRERAFKMYGFVS